MVMNYKEAGQHHADQYGEGVRRVNAFVDSLAREEILPERFPETQPKKTAGKLEIPIVNEGLYNKTREALEKQGLSFIVAIAPESIGQLAARTETGSFFGYINSSRQMRSNVPPQIELAIDPNNFRIANSNNLPTDVQFEWIKGEETILKGKLPADVRNVISLLRPKHASILAQLDFGHQKRTGKVLFTDWFGRTDDQTVPGYVARVGRSHPTLRLGVGDWSRGSGGGDVFAVSAVVLPRKLAV